MNENKKSNKETDSFLNPDVIKYLGLGTQLAGTVAVMVLLGYWLDSKFDLKPVLTIIFSFLGIIVGMYQFIKTVIKSDK
jgi:F0F1-type ATP synthase assembly protein I